MLIAYCSAFIGGSLFIIYIVISFFSSDNEEIAVVLNFVAMAFMLIALSVFLFPKSAKEIFSENAGSTVLGLKCWNSDTSMKCFGSAIMLKKGILITNARTILDDAGNVFQEMECYFLANDYVSRIGRNVTVIKYNKELDIAVLGIVPNWRFPKERYDPIKDRSAASLKVAEDIYVLKTSNENGEIMAQGMVLFPLIEKNYCNRKDVFIQLNVPTISGNSGGAILDKRGRFVGMLICNEKAPNFPSAIPIERIVQYVEN